LSRSKKITLRFTKQIKVSALQYSISIFSLKTVDSFEFYLTCIDTLDQW